MTPPPATPGCSELCSASRAAIGKSRAARAILPPTIMLIMVCGCGARVDQPEIRNVLQQQEQAWNRGDLDGFLAHYWNSEELVFRSPKGETRGWAAVRDRYRASYPTPTQMGRLRFEIGHIARTGEDTAEVAGQFRQEVSGATHSGRFYLHLRKIDGAWLIVRDVTVAD